MTSTNSDLFAQFVSRVHLYAADTAGVKAAYNASYAPAPVEVGHGKYFAPLAQVARQKGFPLFWRPLAKLNARHNASAITVYRDPNYAGERHPAHGEKNINHIILGDSQSTPQTLRVLAHEIAHVCTDDGESPLINFIAHGDHPYVAGIKSEVIAESAALLVCASMNLAETMLPISAAYIVGSGGVNFITELRPIIDQVAMEILTGSGIHGE